ncbi:MAG: alkaline phosphatase family protein [Firmicutes bacterium]|nr:alkaline phosphatase family protein [Bacillota bacterium]
MRRLRALPLFLVALIVLGQAALAPASGAPAADLAHASLTQLGPTVVVVVLDGCPVGSLDLLPDEAFLGAARRGCDCGEGCGTGCADGDCLSTVVRTVFPSSTAAGHAAIFTGSYPEENGVTGKEYLLADGSPGRFSSPGVLERPTLFEVARAAGYGTAMMSAKKNVRLMLSGAADVSVGADDAPDWILSVAGPPPDESEQYADYAGWHVKLDLWVLSTVRAYLESNYAPALIGVNLGSPDKCGHRYGPAPAKETATAVAAMSQGLEALAATLDATRAGNWCMIVTADHGMTQVDKGITVLDIIDEVAESTGSEITATLDGGVLCVWAEGKARDELAKAFASTEGVAEVIGSDGPDCPEGAKDQARRAELRIRHPRTAPLIALVQSGYMFIESPLFMDYTRGSHGTADLDSDVLVPLIVYGPQADHADVDQLVHQAKSVTDICSIVIRLLGRP